MSVGTIGLVDLTTATGIQKELLDSVQKAFGVTPNMTKAMAASPALLRGYLALSGALGSGVLEAPARERLAIATAEENGCSYCLSAHTYFGRELAKLSEEELAAARDGTSSDPHAQALLTLSEAVLRTRGAVAPGVLEAARAEGITDAEIGEVVGSIALNVLTNYFNVLAGVEIDWPLVEPRS